VSLTVGTKICGLVDASGAGGCSIGSSDDWSLVFHLAAYRAEADLIRASLRCEMPMTSKRMEQWMSRVKPYSMLQALVVGFTEQGAAVISNLEILEKPDSGLAEIRDELLVPVIVQSPTFGAFVLDRRLDHYDGNAQWCGVEVRLSLCCSDLSNPTVALSAAESLFRAQADWGKRAKDFAADRLLELKNESWLGEDEQALSREEFISRMTIKDISVDESGDFDLWHDDGDLFWGHSILVSGNLAAGLADAGIHG